MVQVYHIRYSTRYFLDISLCLIMNHLRPVHLRLSCSRTSDFFLHDGQTSWLLLQMKSIVFILFLRYKNLPLDEGEVYLFLVCLKISYEMFLHTLGILQVTGVEVSLNIFPFSLLPKMRFLDLRRLFGISTFIFLSIADLKISNTFLSSEQILQITIVCNLASLSKDISILIVYTDQ